MQFLNINRNTLKKPPFSSADPANKGTWLTLLCYCCDLENGGLIECCREWTDREWLITCGVSRAEVMDIPTKLWSFNGDDLRLFAYPMGAELKCKQKRALASRGGKKAAANRSSRRAAVADAQANASTKEKGKGKGKAKGKTNAEGKCTPHSSFNNEVAQLDELERGRSTERHRLNLHDGYGANNFSTGSDDDAAVLANQAVQGPDFPPR